jgi:predicted nucleic acid-binding protein
MSISDRGYLLDTNLFNAALDGKISLEELRGLSLFATHVQADELRNTKNSERAERLLVALKEIAPNRILTRSAVYDVNRYDEARYSDDDGVFEKMLARLKQLDVEQGKKPRDWANQPRDILTAETAIKDGLTLVTNDANLRRVTTEFGGSAITTAELRLRHGGLPHSSIK